MIASESSTVEMLQKVLMAWSKVVSAQNYDTESEMYEQFKNMDFVSDKAQMYLMENYGNDFEKEILL